MLLAITRLGEQWPAARSNKRALIAALPTARHGGVIMLAQPYGGTHNLSFAAMAA